MLRPIITALFILACGHALAGDLPAVGTRTIGSQTYFVDRNGMTVCKLREVSPGNWHVLDTRGMTVGTVTGSPGVPPVVLGPVRR
ncbi:hypothetical protein A6A04_12290 [Paramagnetospirillum marisnigri]|uniref:Uncharacterized protein n=1 Tax=Paramagnetospirillum marisnigri TaxID=1285242 RepID=A0A178MX85_9PROT|nr:hypothetical protein [Paramagnetospirillum marisnigri]OAN54019.1 hypothetical protein A6A04_12290 [Paramagnetospirillum marisnigri]